MSASGSVPTFPLTLTSAGKVKLAKKYTLVALRIVYEDRRIIPRYQLRDIIARYDKYAPPPGPYHVTFSTQRLMARLEAVIRGLQNCNNIWPWAAYLEVRRTLKHAKLFYESTQVSMHLTPSL